MIVYGHRSRAISVSAFLHSFRERLQARPAPPDADTTTALFVDFGEVEAAVADALLPERDDEHPLVALWSSAGQSMAAALVATRCGATMAAADWLGHCARSVDLLLQGAQPAMVQVRPPEGFAYYALYPDQYITAACDVVRQLQPGRLLCLGIRSIGCPLAHVAAAAAIDMGCSADVRTVRPRGHPFDRHVRLGAGFTAFIGGGGFSHVAVVDEGPGLSGSSLASVIEALEAIGLPHDRLLLLPAWPAPAGALCSPRARRIWTTCRIFVRTFEDSVVKPWQAEATDVRDLSAGQWRTLPALALACRRVPVHPQHERRKVLATRDGQSILWRFAGLGRYGQQKLERAGLLHDAGFGPRPITLRNGFLALEWISGAPHRRAALPHRALLDTLGEYTALLRTACTTDCADDGAELEAMMRANVIEGLGPAWGGTVDALAGAAACYDEPRTAIDGRLLPHEFIEVAGPRAVVKVDALDHHDDDFFPGCRDVAWDLAGAIEEFALNEAAAAAVLGRYAALSGDRSIAMRLPFYRAAYLAYRLGYTTLAAAHLPDAAEAFRFRRVARRIRRSLAARLAAHPAIR